MTTVSIGRPVKGFGTDRSPPAHESRIIKPGGSFAYEIPAASRSLIARAPRSIWLPNEPTDLQWRTMRWGEAWDLTVDDLHTFYVVAGTQSVLVHNAGSCPRRLHWSSLTSEETTALHTTLGKIRSADYSGLNRHTFKNSNGQLPVGVKYEVYDVASEASDRGVRRVVVGSDGSTYYTNTHYGDTGGYDFFTITSP